MVAGVSLLRGDKAYLRNATSEMQVSFLAGARVGPVRAVAHILRRGTRSAVVRVDVHDVGADDLHVATATLDLLGPIAATTPASGLSSALAGATAQPFAGPNRSQSQIIMDSKGAASTGRTGASFQISLRTGASRSPTVAGSSSR